jgi:outer membrane protein OmpA-like peptidoglycan-associated protein
MALRKALLAATVLALPVAVQAQPISGLYVGAGAGANWMMDSDATLSGAAAAAPFGPDSRRGTLSFDMGYVALVSLGWGFGNGVRAEAEFSFRDNDVDTISGFNAASGPVRSVGRVRTYGFMANALYDFHLGPAWPVVPYIGVGAGYAILDGDKVAQTSIASPSTVVQIPGSDGRFAYQAIVGAALSLSPAVPGLSLTAEYRFFGTLDPEVNATSFRPAGFSRGKAELENYNHSVLLGLRYAFNQPAPPPPVVAPVAPPAAAPAPARTYLVFFDWDRANLTDRARQIIAEAAQNSRTAQGVTRIEVSGHADRSGTPQYNQRLSERRANAVAAELERQGVSRGQMSIQAFGESRPLVPTADGVREPQNRRVEIVLR